MSEGAVYALPYESKMSLTRGHWNMCISSCTPVPHEQYNTIQYNTNDFLLDNEPSTKFNRKWIITAYKQTYTRNKK